MDKRRYRKISIVKDGILYYSDRILSIPEFGGNPSLCKAALDLTETTFCVPVTDCDSPIAHAIVDEIHWHHIDVKHKGVESVLRQVHRYFYIIGGGGGGENYLKLLDGNAKNLGYLRKMPLKSPWAQFGM